MRKIGAVLLVIFVFICLVACSSSVKEREKEILLSVGSGKVIFSERIGFDGVYTHIVCKDNVAILVSTNAGFFGGTNVLKVVVLNPNEIACVKK